MFAVTPSGNLAVSSSGAKSTDAAGERLQRLMAGMDERDPGFPAELHALLLNLTPQMLQRLESLVASGIDLPQAARQLLADVEALPSRGWPDGLAPPGVSGDASLAAMANRSPEGGASAQVVARGMAADLAIPPQLASAVSPGQAGDTTPRPTLPPQLTSSLLDMGIPQPVGSRQWSGALADRMLWMAQGDKQFARLTLNPPQLGPLEVRIAVSQEQTSVTFVSAHAAVREALEIAMPRLRDLFDQQSLALVHAEIADPGAQRDPQGRGDAAALPAAMLDDAAGQPGDEGDTVPTVAASAVARGLVDLFA